MFTGIVEEIGVIEKIIRGSYESKLKIKACKIMEDINLGDSISINGICLTVVEYTKNYFTVDVMDETWEKTSLKNLRRGSYINLERAMKLNSRFGGHIVSGHIDGYGKIKKIRKDGNANWFDIDVDKDILENIVNKGSITIDGISLTVSKIDKNSFSVSVIPHTFENTILKYKKVNDFVNLENDILGKYVKQIYK